jgi:hypothetical protein
MTRRLLTIGCLATFCVLIVTANPSSLAAAERPRIEVLMLDRMVHVSDLPTAATGLVRETSDVPQPDTSLREFQTGGSLPQVTSIDFSPGGIAAPTSSPPTLVSEFDAVDNQVNAGLGLGYRTPPDAQLAAGPTRLLEMVNLSGRVFDKTTFAVVTTFKLNDFFGVLTPRCFDGAPPPCWYESDPKLLYDSGSGRWIATYLSFIDKPSGQVDEARLHIAVSQSGDPAGSWYLYYHPYTVHFPDQPWVGVTNDKITITSNLFGINPQAFVGEQTRVYNKAQALAGGPVTVAVFPTRSSLASVRPAQTMDSMNDQYAGMISGNTLKVFKYIGVPGQADVTETITQVSVSGHTYPPGGTNPGGYNDTGDGRLVDAFVHVGYLWTMANTGCIPPGDTATRSCLQIFQINPPSTLVQQIVYGASGQYYYYPAGRTDFGGGLIVTFTRSNSSLYAEARIAGRQSSDPTGTLSSSVLLRLGQNGTNGRWGDYFAAARDPSGLGLCIWLVAEYAKNIQGPTESQRKWGTSVAKARYQSSC